MNQVATKVGYALATGCTCVLKPSEVAPLSAILFAEILDEAGVPKGVFNLVNGDGPTVGNAISSHPQIDMVSFTGSTKAGIQVAQAAALSVKRVQQELGGKSANIILPGADLSKAIPAGVLRAFTNSGQSCQAPTRMIVPRQHLDEILQLARATAESVVVGDPNAEGVRLGPLVSEAQFHRVQQLIETGISEGGTVVAGGLGRPEGLNKGYFARPTVFADITPAMTLAQQEIFGPVLVILSYDTEDEAVGIANDSVYGLAGYVYGATLDDARRVGARLQAGRIYLNGAPHGRLQDVTAPFGGYKQSGNGREVGIYGFEDFLEIKALIGYEAA